ncbi:VanZ family protein [Saccharicrinis fermentans]|uniref:Putative integral membrane protein n=1 Tax=Saccharicrinis fermentans DSM 9555 = JCM 21142 TaxID=869213 RepID=W7YGR4_9BACT|nr:putative integral membrane protein [Saccharicrinis fermentans DSM 9555 = JCM 21142]
MFFIKNYWRSIFLFLTIFFLSVSNVNNLVPDKVQLFHHFDKFAHFTMYLTLSFVFFIENHKSTKPIRKGWIVLDTIVLGILLEFIQLLFTNNRSGNFYDAVFNTIGVMTGSIFFFALRNSAFIYRLMLFKKVYNK